MRISDDFKLFDAAGSEVDPRAIKVERLIKGSRERPRWAYAARMNDQAVLLKVRPLRTLEARLRATLGRSYFQREAEIGRAHV